MDDAGDDCSDDDVELNGRWQGDGSVVTWGHAEYGGDSRTVQGQLKNVRQIRAADRAFAAVLGDGCVVTWGEKFGCGDSAAVRRQLRKVSMTEVLCDPGRRVLDLLRVAHVSVGSHVAQNRFLKPYVTAMVLFALPFSLICPAI